MAKSYVYTEVNGQKLKLSNLNKVIYPEAGVTKAEIIQYYLDVAPLILKYIAQRPLTLIRFPDGIDKTKFYAKTKPTWTPEWIKSFKIQHSEESIPYIVADSQASVIWLANLAALELHPMQMTIDDYEHPDHFIFDLDPPLNGDFEHVKTIALKLKTFLEGYGYAPFIKTSGSKGLHICTPIVKKYSHEEMVLAVKSLAKIFVSQNKELSTLTLTKNKREGKILIDILRNHESHTTVAPYSLRGQPGAPVSFPVKWEWVSDLDSSKDIHIRNYKEYINDNGDVWEEFYNSATLLHSDKERDEGVSEKIQEKLKTYLDKRDFGNTPEPGIEPELGKGQRYCIQLHDASNLHYDLRLEEEGTLLSWAIPKGLPYQPNVKRMAIKTEDHPLKYLTFEGVIPKGQYGAGSMWVYNFGKIEWLEKKETKYKFKLKSKDLDRSYSLFRTKDNQWLIQLIDINDKQLSLPIEPMLADQSKSIPIGSNLVYEIKWDGIRCILRLENKKVTIYSRSGRDISDKFPELLDPDLFEVESGIFDGEIVCLDAQGRPMFSQVISRMHSLGEKKIKKQVTANPAVCYLFDCLSLDGKTIIQESLLRRQAWLNCAIKKNKHIRISEAIEDGKALYIATKEMDIEGIMAKDKNAKYSIGQRTKAWQKVKHRSQAECFIAGYTKGEGDRSNLFGALHLLLKEEGQFKYMGKVGTGFDASKMKKLLAIFKDYISKKKHFDDKTDDDRTSVWLKPELKCKIQYASLSSTGTYREPVFLELLK